jgi:Tol biopolymer transport system component
MNSWHAWSSDSRWIVFSTKRDRNELTALYLAEIDPGGAGHPPVKIASDDEYKVNLPFLVPEGSRLDFGKDLPKFIDSIMRR